MWYKGTKQECESYNKSVADIEKYIGKTNKWAEIKSHPNGIDFAIRKHPKYESNMELTEQLNSTWFPEIQ